MATVDEVESLYEDFKRAESLLTKAGEISALDTLSVVFKNNLVLTSASNAERTLTAFFEELMNANGLRPHLASFCKKAAFDQRYHTFFDWKQAESANPEKGIEQFLGKFGTQFKAEYKNRITGLPNIKEGAAKFILIGNQRNEMVHLGFKNYTNNKTNSEIIADHLLAKQFLQFTMDFIAEFSSSE